MPSRRKKALPGQLTFYYGKLPGESPDFCISWGGEGAGKRSANLILHIFCGPRYKLTHISGTEQEKASGLPVFVAPSLVDELRARGYDLSTIYFSIQKLDPARPPKPGRPRQAAPGCLTVRFAKLRGFDPDLVFSSGGEGAGKSDCRLICNHLTEKMPIYTPSRGSSLDVQYERSNLDALKEAGYDISTFFLTVKHKGVDSTLDSIPDQRPVSALRP